MLRSTRLLLEVAGFLIAGLAVLLAAVAWRLSTGPVETDFLTPYLEDALNAGPVRLSLGGTSLRWDGFDQPLEIVATDVTLHGDDAGPVARVPALSVALGVRGLLQGRLLPRRIALVEPHVRIERTAEGVFRFALGAGAAVPEVAGGGVVPALLAALRAAPDEPRRPLDAIEALSVARGEITVDDRMLGIRWYAPRADIQLRRIADGIAGTALLDVEVGERIARLEADLDHRADGGRTTVELRVDNLVPADLAASDPVLAPLAVLASPVRGTVRATFGPTFLPLGTTFALRAGAGVLRLDGLYPEPLRVASLGVAGDVDLPGGVLTVERFVADLGGPRLEGAATVTDRAGTLAIEGTGAVLDLPTDLLAGYWPERLGRGARAWVTRNLSRGIVRRAEARMSARMPAEDLGRMRLLSLAGDIGFDGVSVRYLDGMPPVTGVAGTAAFDRRSFTLDLTAGRLQDLAVTEAAVAITGFEAGRETIDVEVVAAGPAAAALAVLDHPPLSYASKIGIAPADAAGVMSARLRFAFPLKRGLSVQEVGLAAAANLQDVRLGEVIDGIAATRLNGALSLDGRGLELTGTAELNGVPVDVSWTERFGSGPGARRRITLAGTLDPARQAALGLPVYDGLTGDVPVEAVYTASAGAASTVAAELDLTGARLTVDPLGWTKPPGVPGRADLTLELNGDELSRLSSFALRTPDLVARGDAVFAPGTGAVAEWRLTEFEHGRNRFGLQATRQPGGGYAVELRGPSLDAGPALDGLFGGAGRDREPGAAGAEPGPPLQATVVLDRVYVGEDRAVFGVNGVLVRRDGAWDAIDLAGRTDTDAPMRLSYGPGADGVVRLSVTADDAGAALRTFDLVGTVRGGRLVIDGTRLADAAAPGTAFVGRLRMDRFRVVRAPVLARLLAALSLGGLNDLLTSDGIDFSRLVAGYRLDDGVLAISDARTSGGALGLTLDGTVDLDTDRVDVEGTIVPLSGVNKVIGAIPIIGDLLTGGEGQGVFAFTYGVEGPLAEPRVTVNPLAVLAPGFLRNLFFLDGDVGRPPAR